MRPADRHRSVDISYSSNVLEHVVSYRSMLAEMVRVVAPGGVIDLTFTNWLSPWGGHETSPWHYLGGEWSARRFERKTGAPPKNRFGVSLFRLDVHDVMSWCEACSDVEVLDTFPGTTRVGRNSWSRSPWYGSS